MGMNGRFYPDEFSLTTSLVDVSSAGSAWVVCPYPGRIKKIYATIAGTIATAALVLTAEIGGVAVSGISISIPYSGSAAGDTGSAVPINGAGEVAAGGTIEIVSAHACTNTIVGEITIVMERI